MKKIAIVCGGYSGEYEISVQSAHMVSENLDTGKYRTWVIYIDKDQWYFLDDAKSRHPIDKADFSLTLPQETVHFDGVFNAIHGTPGEDGILAAYFDLLDIPHTSSDMECAALTFNKYLCNMVVQSLGIKVAKSFSFLKGEHIDKGHVIESLGLPLFVKPAKSGSSVGVSKVNSAADFKGAIEKAFEEGDRILIEEFLDGREFACGLYAKDGNLTAMPLAEIISKKDFFDYEAKYTPGMADEISPPENLDPTHDTQMKIISSMLYRELGCKGLVRIDYMLTEAGLYFIEINTIPGMSPASLVIKEAKAMGLTNAQLFDTMVEMMFG